MALCGFQNVTAAPQLRLLEMLLAVVLDQNVVRWQVEIKGQLAAITTIGEADLLLERDPKPAQLVSNSALAARAAAPGTPASLDMAASGLLKPAMPMAANRKFREQVHIAL
jgi:hypothetical protein